MEKKITVNGVELDFDVMELENAEKYERARSKVVKKCEEFQRIDQSNASLTWVIKTTCKAVFEFFDSIFGEGTAKQIFGDHTNMGECLKAFFSFDQQAAAEIKALGDTLHLPAAQVKK